MFLSNPFFEPLNDSVIVWIGSLNSRELEDYLDEPGGAGNNEPISDFCRDVGRWYDHDFIWCEASDTPTSVGTLCEMNGVEPIEFKEAIVKRSGDAEETCLLVLWNARQIDDSGRSFAGGKLRCIGCWKQKSILKDPVGSP